MAMFGVASLLVPSPEQGNQYVAERWYSRESFGSVASRVCRGETF